MLNKDFKVDELVTVIAGEFVDTGTILGTASRHIVDCYIVLLDHPTEEYKAGVFPEGCITRQGMD
jgi:hypothetical protein